MMTARMPIMRVIRFPNDYQAVIDLANEDADQLASDPGPEPAWPQDTE